MIPNMPVPSRRKPVCAQCQFLRYRTANNNSAQRAANDNTVIAFNVVADLCSHTLDALKTRTMNLLAFNVTEKMSAVRSEMPHYLTQTIKKRVVC